MVEKSFKNSDLCNFFHQPAELHAVMPKNYVHKMVGNQHSQLSRLGVTTEYTYDGINLRSDICE